MNTVLEEKADIEDFAQEEYTPADHDEVMRVSERLLNQHREAYTALANA